MASFKGNIVFTDKKARQAKEYNPQADRVRILLGDGEEGEQDGTGETGSSKCTEYASYRRSSF